MRFLLRVCWFLVKALLTIGLPFVVLLKGTLYLYGQHELSTWIALVIGGLLTCLLLILYAVVFLRKVSPQGTVSRATLKGTICLVGMLVLGFFVYSMANLSGENAKTEAVREEFTRLHPFLKLGAGVVLLVDGDLLITDMTRSREDYGEMGLTASRRSLHYPQADGYVHAIDLRTRNRAEIRNWLLEKYFRLMGFHTLRHEGTADHLHVSIPVAWLERQLNRPA